MHIDKLPKLLFIFNQRSPVKNSLKINAYCNVMILRRCVMQHDSCYRPASYWFQGHFQFCSFPQKSGALCGALWHSILDTNKLGELKSLLISISLKNDIQRKSKENFVDYAKKFLTDVGNHYNQTGQIIGQSDLILK